jgi:hypothetical protein
MQLVIKYISTLIFIFLLFIVSVESVSADAPGYRGRVVTSTGAGVPNVWVKVTDSAYISDLPDGQRHYTRTDSNGNFRFDSWHKLKESDALAFTRTPVDTDLNGVNDDTLAVIRTMYNAPPEIEWWMAFGCGEGPMSITMVIPSAWTGSSSTIGGINVSNDEPSDRDVGNIVFNGSMPDYAIGGNVYVDSNRNATKDAGEVNYANASVIISGAESSSTATNTSGNYQFDDLNAGNYTASITIPSGYIATSPSSVATTLGPSRTINFGIVPNNSISGNVFTDLNANGIKNTGDGNYQGASITLSGTASRTGTTDSLGNYSFTNLAAGSYTVAITTPSGYSLTTPASRTVTAGINTTVDFGVSQFYTVSGNLFVDIDANGVLGSSEGNYSGRPTIMASRGVVTVNANGTYTISNLLAGPVTISYSGLPPGYFMTYPLNGPPPSYLITVGPSCSTNGANGATCALNISNLNFGINNTVPWVQTVCGDFRDDAGVTNPIPITQQALTTNATCSQPGILYTGNGNVTVAPGQLSSENWRVGGTTYPEVYRPSSAGGISTSYANLYAKAQSIDTPPTNLATVCTLSSCTLPNNLQNGVYVANGDVTLNAASFNPNRDYVFLINGNLTIRGNVITPRSSISVFSASGNIIVASSVGNPATVTTANLSGIFSTDRSFIMNSNNNCTDLRLNLEGTLIVNAGRTGGGLQNNRNLCVGNVNNPALQMTQRLDFALNLPEFVRIQSVISNEISP